MNPSPSRVLEAEVPIDTASFYPALGSLIGGEWVGEAGRSTRAVVDPGRGDTIAALPEATAQDVEQALQAAHKAFESWRRTPPATRAGVLMRAAALMRGRADRIARTITLELGKPLSESLVEVERLAGVYEWHAAEAQRIYGRLVPGTEGINNLVLREPIGVVAALTPWNGPAASPGRKISAALAAGCTVVVKPAEETPGSAIHLAQCLLEAGLPAGALNMVFGDPGRISTQLISSPIVRAVTFTGSVPVGRQLAALAGQHLKPAVLELGGHSPVIVCEDCDVDAVADACARRKFLNAGQICMSPTRFFIQQRVHDRFVEAFAKTSNGLRIGSGFHPQSQVGPLANARRREAIERLVEQARSVSATLVAGGTRLGERGFYYAPTVLTDVGNAVEALRVEPFGPIALMMPFHGLDEAISRANDTPYGLSAFAFTNSAASADRILHEVECGIVSVNHFMGAGDSTPFGGMKDSGYGREGGSECFDGYLVSKLASHRVR